MHAAPEGNIEVLKVLLAGGANKDKADSLGGTALSYATSKSHTEMIALLE